MNDVPSTNSLTPGRLLLIRHGETDHNVELRVCGWTDSRLSQRGVRQTELLGIHVAAAYQIDRLYASPLQRAWLTARAITERTGLDPVPIANLREINFGELEGLTTSEFAERFPDLYRSWRTADYEDLQWPGGESRWQFRERVIQTLAPLEAESRHRTVAVVSHGGVIASYLATRVAGNPRRWAEFHVRNCSITEITWNGSAEPVVIGRDMIEHLND